MNVVDRKGPNFKEKDWLSSTVNGIYNLSTPSVLQRMSWINIPQLMVYKLSKPSVL